MQPNEFGNKNNEEDSIEFQVEEWPLKHSGLGISSFVVSLVAGVALFGLFAVAVAIQIQNPESMKGDSAMTTILGLFVICIAFIDVIALGLGIGGLFQKRTKKILAILGVVFSGVVLLIFVLLMIIGMLA